MGRLSAQCVGGGQVCCGAGAGGCRDGAGVSSGGDGYAEEGRVGEEAGCFAVRVGWWIAQAKMVGRREGG